MAKTGLVRLECASQKFSSSGMGEIILVPFERGSQKPGHRRLAICKLRRVTATGSCCRFLAAADLLVPERQMLMTRAPVDTHHRLIVRKRVAVKTLQSDVLLSRHAAFYGVRGGGSRFSRIRRLRRYSAAVFFRHVLAERSAAGSRVRALLAAM